jgi:3-oxoacyl-[acyl-carrier-protein] synthase II
VKRRVVVTGIGVVASTGVGRDAFWDGLAAGRSGASLVDVAGVAEIAACRVEGFDPVDWFGRREARRMDRVAQLAAATGRMALEDAGDLRLPPERIGASVGCAHGGALTLDEAYATMIERGADRVSPFTIPLALTNVAAAAAARVNELRGPSSAVCTACAAGADAIGVALSQIREGRADAMLAGGAEAPIAAVVVAGYRTLGALASTARGAAGASRPFDAQRDGFVIGEGAGLLVLEELEHARARGARVYCELAGYGSSCDASHLTDPDETGGGPASAIEAALADAGVSSDEVGYVNAHATSTPSGDAAEARALLRAGLGRAPVSSTKSMHGHTLGAAGGVEAVASILPLVRGVLPPTINLLEPDDDCGLDHICETARSGEPTATLSNSFGFGGHNAALVFRRLS